MQYRHIKTKSPPPGGRARGTLYGLTLVFFLSAVCVFIYITIQQQITDRRHLREFTEMDIIQRRIDTEMQMVSSEFDILINNSLIKSAMTQNNSSSKKHLTKLMEHLVATHPRYLQIRLIDTTGHENFRIFKTNLNHILTTPDSLLQNKNNRYYVNQGFKLKQNEVYISPIDLNIEFDTIQKPYVPTLRFVSPLFQENNISIGLGVLSYQGKILFDVINNLKNDNEETMYILNSESYYLQGPDPKSSWGFMLKDRAHRTFNNEHKKEWKEMQANTAGVIATLEGEMVYKHISLALTGNFKTIKAPTFTIICLVPNAMIAKETEQLMSGLQIGFLLLSPLLFFLGWRVGNYQVHQKWLFRRLEVEATHDSLTSLLNRKALFEILKKNMFHAIRRKSPLSLCYIDLNDLKLINDQMGHKMGDILLKKTADSIQSNIRYSDSAARIGGDEFIVLFPDCPEQSAHDIMERISMSFTAAGVEETGRLWCLSYGCTELKQDDLKPEQIIDRADKLMYAHKISSKNKSTL